jgi:hypothetical protein
LYVSSVGVGVGAGVGVGVGVGIGVDGGADVQAVSPTIIATASSTDNNGLQKDDIARFIVWWSLPPFVIHG